MTQPVSSSLAAVDKWTADASGAWSIAAHWSLCVPRAWQSVDIETATPLTVTFDIGDAWFRGLTLGNDALDLEGGGLAVRGYTSFRDAALSGTKNLKLFGASDVSGLALAGSAQLINWGVATQSGGSLVSGESPASTARIINTAYATWIVADGSGMSRLSNAGWGFVNAGLFKKASGSGIALIQANFLSTGTIASAAGGDIEFDGQLTKLSGVFIGAGMIDFGPDGVARIGNVEVTGSTCQTNWGVVDLVGDMTMHDGSTIMNEAGAVWNFAADSSILLAAAQTGSATIAGAGAIAKTAGTGTSVVGIDANAQGGIDIETGALEFAGASSEFSGAITGAGVFEIGAGSAQIEAGASLNVASWTLAGGTTTLDEAVTYGGVFVGEARATLTLGGPSAGLTLTGPPIINQQATLSGLNIMGSGTLTLSSATVISAATIGGTVNLVDNFDVIQTGTITLGDASAADQASLTVAAFWVIKGGVDILLGANPASTVTIAGRSNQITKGDAGVSVFAPNLVNNGLDIPSGNGYQPGGINVTGGTLEFKGAVSGTGSDNISGNGSNNFITESTLQFDAAVGAGQTVNFFSTGAALSLTDLPDFHAAITNFDAFGSTDYILISGGYVLAGETETAASTTLTLALSGHAQQTLTLTGDYRGKTFFSFTDSGVLRIM